MGHELQNALNRAEQAIELVARTRGRSSREYERAVREYQRLVAMAVQQIEVALAAV